LLTVKFPINIFVHNFNKKRRKRGKMSKKLNGTVINDISKLEQTSSQDSENEWEW
jgi:hypothetical protein